MDPLNLLYCVPPENGVLVANYVHSVRHILGVVTVTTTV